MSNLPPPPHEPDGFAGDDFTADDFEEAFADRPVSRYEARQWNVTSPTRLSPADQLQLETEIGLPYAALAITGSLAPVDVLWDSSDASAELDAPTSAVSTLEEILSGQADAGRELSMVFVRPHWQRKLLCAPSRLARLLLVSEIAAAWEEIADLGPVEAAAVAAEASGFVAAAIAPDMETGAEGLVTADELLETLRRTADAIAAPGSDHYRALASASPPVSAEDVARKLRWLAPLLVSSPDPDEVEVVVVAELERLSTQERRLAAFAAATAFGLSLLLAAFSTGRSFDMVIAELEATERIFVDAEAVSFWSDPGNGLVFRLRNSGGADSGVISEDGVELGEANPEAT